MGFVNKVLDAGGSILPLVVPAELGTNGTGLFNPSVYVDGDQVLVNIRHCQYTIYHSEKGRFEHQWGPLCYICPENDLTLTTTNWLCKLDPYTLEIKKHHKVDFSFFNKKPIWEFVGLEDCRLFRWDSKLFLCGVRRDTTVNGQGRMELSELKFEGGTFKEISRYRIPSTFDNTSYCEKNWVPILDIPYHFVKWSNPTEIVKVDTVNKKTEQVFVGTKVDRPYDFRGGSQVINFGDYRITIAHVLTQFYRDANGRKNAQYRHCFIVWDKNWNVVKYGDLFDFMGGEIEFCCGLAEHNGNFLITFGYQDNAAYILKVPKKVIEEFVYG